MKNSKRTILALFVFILTIGTWHPLHATVSEVEITYTGNEGFLIVSGGKKILIDAFHRLGNVKNQELIQNGHPPFDDVGLILTTHTDHDHFDLHMVGHYLANHPNTQFISTKQATGAFEKYYKNFAKISAQLRGFAPQEREKIHFSHDGIDMTMILLHHGRNRQVKITNLGFIIRFGGKKFFHMGDSEIVLSEMNTYNLPEEKIDVAFVPYWYFTSSKYKPALKKGIGAKQVIPMHLILVDGGRQERQRILDIISGEFPDAILFSKETEKRIIQ